MPVGVVSAPLLALLAACAPLEAFDFSKPPRPPAALP